LFRVLTHLIETQGRVGGLEPGRRIRSKWKLGQNSDYLDDNLMQNFAAEAFLRKRKIYIFLLHDFD
jgi:hypothetical protein